MPAYLHGTIDAEKSAGGVDLIERKERPGQPMGVTSKLHRRLTRPARKSFLQRRGIQKELGRGEKRTPPHSFVVVNGTDYAPALEQKVAQIEASITKEGRDN